MKTLKELGVRRQNENRRLSQLLEAAKPSGFLLSKCLLPPDSFGPYSKTPSTFKSSALSTATPAAPRTVLCPIATNL